MITDDLDLPPLDGEEDAESNEVHEDIDDLPDTGDAFDDATHDGDPLDDFHQVDGAEGGWLTDSDEAAGLDVGALDIATFAEEKVLEPDEPEVHHAADDDLGSDTEHAVEDTGEEGPLADDEELREEDLPALDADEDGDVDDAELFDRALLTAADEEELRWDDRAWAKVDDGERAEGENDDSGALAVPGDDPAATARDATWRRLDGTGRVTAAAFVPGDAVVLALMTPDQGRALLVRIRPDGAASIIAEISEEEPRVAQLRWDAARGQLVASGAFGTQAFRPAL